MPIINGRVHLHRRPVSPRHQAAFIACVAAAILLVGVGWTLTVGRQLSDFAGGLRASLATASAAVAQAQGSAGATVPAPSPANFIPALHAALQAEQTSAGQAQGSPVGQATPEGPAPTPTTPAPTNAAPVTP